MIPHWVNLSNYGIGVCVSAIGLWFILKWRDETLTDFQWVLAILAILAWPVAFSLGGLLRLIGWVKYRYELAQDYRSPDRR